MTGYVPIERRDDYEYYGTDRRYPDSRMCGDHGIDRLGGLWTVSADDRYPGAAHCGRHLDSSPIS